TGAPGAIPARALPPRATRLEASVISIRLLDRRPPTPKDRAATRSVTSQVEGAALRGRGARVATTVLIIRMLVVPGISRLSRARADSRSCRVAQLVGSRPPARSCYRTSEFGRCDPSLSVIPRGAHRGACSCAAAAFEQRPTEPVCCQSLLLAVMNAFSPQLVESHGTIVNNVSLEALAPVRSIRRTRSRRVSLTLTDRGHRRIDCRGLVTLRACRHDGDRSRLDEYS